MVQKRVLSLFPMFLLLVGLVLIVDQLYLFGIPFGGFLGDLSRFDITGSPYIHHWMVGVVLVVYVMLLKLGGVRQ